MPSSKHPVHDGTAEGGHHAEADEHDGCHQLQAESKRRVWVSKVKQKPFSKYTQFKSHPDISRAFYGILTSSPLTSVFNDFEPRTDPGPDLTAYKTLLDDLISHNK